MNKILKVITCLLFICHNTLCASPSIKPKWLTQSVPESASRSYIFISTHGEGYSLDIARQYAFLELMNKLESERGLVINKTLKSTTHNRVTSSGVEGYRDSEIEVIAEEKDRTINIVCREIDEYCTERSGKYNVDVLYTVTDKNSYGGSYDDDIKVSAKYGAGAGFMSVIPSVGQFYKGSITKGSLILAGEIAAIGGVILCENTRASYIKKMQEQPRHTSEYNSLADSWENGRNICIGAAAAIYVYNIIDAFASPGAKRVIVKKGKASLSAVPYATSNTIGLGLALKY